MVNIEEYPLQTEESKTEAVTAPVVQAEPAPLPQPVELKNSFVEAQRRAAERQQWEEKKLAQALKAVEDIKNESPGTQIRINGMVGPDYEGLTRTNQLFYKLGEVLNQEQQFLRKGNKVYGRVLPAGEGIYARLIQDVGEPGFLGAQKIRAALDIVRADTPKGVEVDDIETVLKKGSLEPAPKGESIMGLWEFLKLQHKIGAELADGYEGPSKTMIVLRCIGHSAANTLAENEDDLELPPVNPWKLTKSLAKATVSKEERRALITRIKEDTGLPGSLLLLVVPGIFMRGDLLGYLAMPDLYKMAKEEGLSDKDAAADVIIRLASPNLPKEKTDEKTAA